MAKEIVAMILAGGRGSRLYALTQKTAKPAVSFGGKYRIVDFPLSNCVNSNIDTVGIATQYQPQKLNEYIGNGQPWDLDRLHGGVHTLPPYEQAKGTDWYKGTANAIYQNIGFIDSYLLDKSIRLAREFFLLSVKIWTVPWSQFPKMLRNKKTYLGLLLTFRFPCPSLLRRLHPDIPSEHRPHSSQASVYFPTSLKSLLRLTCIASSLQ